MELKDLYGQLEMAQTDEEIKKIKRKITYKKYYEKNKQKIIQDTANWKKKNRAKYLETRKKHDKTYRDRKKMS